MAEAHIGLALILARKEHRRLRARGFTLASYEEIESAALLGLSRAAARWRPVGRFGAYAQSVILGAIREEARQARRWWFGSCRNPHRAFYPESSAVKASTDDSSERAATSMICGNLRVACGERGARVLVESVVEGRLLSEIGSDMGVTESAISYARKRAIRDALEYCSGETGQPNVRGGRT